jgi:hypothetical protein
MNYNLLEEEWLPVLCKNGVTNRVGIIEALTQAHRIRQIAASNPMDRVAILRFLLALLYWCKGNPPDQKLGDSFPPEWFEKLRDHRDYFNLLGEGRRFYQYKPGTNKEEKLSANYLIQEVPTGINIGHFRHSIDKVNGLCRACCAFGLLRLPVFVTSGGRGKPPGINAKPPIYVIPLGFSLAETLRLSWRQVSSSDFGTPAWEKPDLRLPISDVPLLTGLTWIPRRVWLDDPVGPEARCISCGRKEKLIQQCVFAGIGSTKSEGGRKWHDPNVIPDTKNVMKPGNALGAHDAGAGQWAKIMAGIILGPKGDGRIWIVGFATVQNDKYLEAMESEIPIHSGAPNDEQIQNVVHKIERWQQEKKAMEKKMGRSKVAGSAAIAAIRPYVEGLVSAKVGELLTGGDDAWEQAAREYSPMMGAVARSLSPGCTTAAVQRRNQIAGVKPDLGSDTKKSKKSGRKGGDK